MCQIIRKEKKTPKQRGKCQILHHHYNTLLTRRCILLGKGSAFPRHQNDSSNYPMHLWFALETYFDTCRARNWNSLREKGNLSQMWVAEQEQKIASFLFATTDLWVAIFSRSKLGKKNSWKRSFVLPRVITSDKLLRSSPLFCKGWG